MLVAAAQANQLPGLPLFLSSICKLPRPTPNTPFEDQTCWLLNRDELDIPEHPISSGNFGEVYKGQELVGSNFCHQSILEIFLGTWRGRVDVAVKKLKVDDGNNLQKAKMDFEQETMVLKHLHHPNLVQIFGICSESPFLIVTEWLENGDLKSFLKDQRQKPILMFDDLIRISGNVLLYRDISIHVVQKWYHLSILFFFRLLRPWPSWVVCKSSIVI